MVSRIYSNLRYVQGETKGLEHEKGDGYGLLHHSIISTNYEQFYLASYHGQGKQLFTVNKQQI